MLTPLSPTCIPMSAFTTALLKDLYVVVALIDPTSQSAVKLTAVEKNIYIYI